MFRKMKTKKIAAILYGFVIFLFSFQPVLAIHIPSANEVAEDIENRYHISQESVQEAMHNYNVSGQKTNSPEVYLTFNPPDPREGQEITALANPTFFKTPTESLYYTWFIVHRDGDYPDYDDDGHSCRWRTGDDGDRYIDDIEDCKTEAAKILAQGYFDQQEYQDDNSNLIDYYPPIDEDHERYPESVLNRDGNKDGYLAHYGGNDAPIRETTSREAGKAPTDQNDHYEGAAGDYCFIRDFKTGIDYELARADNDLSVSSSYDTQAYSTDFSIDCEAEATGGSGGSGGAGGEPGGGGTGGSASAECATTENANPETYTDSNPRTKYISQCRHLFPLSYTEYDSHREYLGDYDYRHSEEYYWLTNPEDPDTLDRGTPDEASILGFGQNKFTWIYQEGDQVGVVVEGESMIQTEYEDNSYQIMWAMPNNKCDALDNISKSRTFGATVKDYTFSIPYIPNFSLNSCLEDNFVDPQQGGQPTLLKPTLSYYPENPVNDSSGEGYGDILYVQSSIGGSDKKTSDLYYEWEISINDAFVLTEEDWNEINYATLNEMGLGQLKGNNLSKLQIPLNFTDEMLRKITDDSNPASTQYLRVNLTVKENFSENEYRKGAACVIIKITSSGEGIEAYAVTGEGDINDAYVLDMEEGTDKRICVDGIERASCPVTKNDIIGLYVNDDIDEDESIDLNNFSWTIDDKKFAPTSCFYAECEGEGEGVEQVNNFAYFPILKSAGEEYTVEVTANDIKSGEVVEFSKKFQVVTPYVKITPNPNVPDNPDCWPKLLGTYYDLNGGEFDNESEDILQTYLASLFPLKAEFHPESIKNSATTLRWSLDGTVVTEDNQDALGATLVPLDPNKDEFFYDGLDVLNKKAVGEAYNLAFSASVVKNYMVKKALEQIWGLTITDFFYEDDLKDTAQVEIVEYNPNLAQKDGQKTKKVLASLVSQFPSQVNFLFRIILTTAMMLFVAGFVFSLNGLSRKYYEDQD